MIYALVDMDIFTEDIENLKAGRKRERERERERERDSANIFAYS